MLASAVKRCLHGERSRTKLKVDDDGRTVHLQIFKAMVLAILVTPAISLIGCASSQLQRDEHGPGPSAADLETTDKTENVDIEALERSLQLARPLQELGYKEAAFNTCSAGYGFSSSQNCRQMVMASINFRIQCRDSVDTISTALGADDLVAIAGQRVRWTMQKHDDTVMTDGQGYANVRGLFPKSPKNDWLRIGVGLQFLNMRANTMTRVVTPRPWCHADR